ncbi:MAG: DNA sulfur modification protein DndD [Alicyclobacillus macrosporangiidus]|uniref:DNA sulfur modification protein DndD n=1 Tax=Alicyclobacillus macrosporangiidus TaxID=392015 RepID=UPI0026EF898E|nr:DNA sulfur modification protein DndD [Alicyclobacillus macrosporangiidus]MCL6597500.1 DNA sulfur modification protein DndD [Alicyclobacillus macrosporangiidus]
MILTAIRLKNFGVYAGEQAIFPSKYPSRPITLIGGMNGCGKTSILEAVLLALYGRRSPRIEKRGKSYSDYLRNLIHANASQSYVEIEFDVPNGSSSSSLRVRRTWGKDSVRLSDHLQVWKDNLEDKYLAENWDSYVEDLLPAAIAELFFFDGEQISELAESDDTLEPLNRAIRSLLGVEVIDRLIRDLSTVMNRIKRRSEQTGTTSKDTLLNLLERSQQLQMEYDRLNQTKASLTNRLIAEKRQLSNLEDKYFGMGGDFYERRRQLEERKMDIAEKLHERRISMGILASGALPLALVRKSLRKLQATAAVEADIHQARIALPVVKDILNDVASLLAYDPAVDHIRKHLSQLEERANTDTYLPSVDSLNKTLKNLDEVLVAEQVQAKELVDSYLTLLNEEEQLDRELSREVDAAELQHLNKQRQELSERIVQLQVQIAEIEGCMQRVKSEQERIEQEVTRQGIALAQQEDDIRVVHYAARVQELMRSFRERLTKAKITTLENNIRKSFDHLTHKSSLVSQITVDVNSLRITLYGPDGNEISKSSLSSGERQMLATAILWGLGQATGRMLPIIIDTPMGRLDSQHRMRFVSEYLPNASHQVIVLSTDTEIDDHYLRTIRQHIGQSYYLSYRNERRSTTVTDGYFDFEGRGSVN